MKEEIKDRDIKVEIMKITGDDPKYDAWSVTAKAWLDEEDVEDFEKVIALNVLKGDGNFDKTSKGNLRILERVKEKYAKILEEEPGFEGFSNQKVESERSKVEEMRGGTYSV